MSMPLLSRRQIIGSLAALPVVSAAPAWAISAGDYNVVPDTAEDQTRNLMAAMVAARDKGLPLSLPPGRYRVQNLEIFGNVVIEGAPGRTVLVGAADAPIAKITGFSGIVLRHLTFQAEGAGTAPMLAIAGGADTEIESCSFGPGGHLGIGLEASSARITHCNFSTLDDAAIHAQNSLGILASGNRIDGCGNAGIRIWRYESGPDGSILTNNRISNIDWRGGGNGQTGNGINVFQADEVIIANNHLAHCAFTAVRLNATKNTQVIGNTCLASGEVAIFSEFGFSGSIIANNIIDGAAQGISMTNFNEGGQLAVCSGNIVRNIAPKSLVNPDTVPIGIAAEADAAVTGNVVQNVPGIGILAGYGPYLRNVLVSDNVISEVELGIGVSVAPEAGDVRIGANLISAKQHAIAGLAWSEIVEADLQANSARFPNVSIESD
jgi:uncharacterized secreted repeat protein (TIGR03808 family)